MCTKFAAISHVICNLGSSGWGRQMTMWLSSAAIFGNFDTYLFRN